MLEELRIQRIGKILRTIPFTLLGLLTIALFITVERIGPGGRDTVAGEVLVEVARFLIVPMWLLGYIVLMLVGLMTGGDPSRLPLWLDIGLTLPIVLSPYLLADAFLYFVHGPPDRRGLTIGRGWLTGPNRPGDRVRRER